MTARKKKPAAGTEARSGQKPESWTGRPGLFALATAGFLLLALVVYFREFIFNSGVMIYGSDMVGQAFQTRKLAVDAVAAGRGIPLWNPFSYCGWPYVGGLPGPIFFPTSILYFLIPLERAIGWSIILMMLAGGMFAYLWVRELGLSRAAGAFSAVAWAFTGWIASTLAGGHDGRQFTMLLTPLVFFFLERGLNRKKFIWFLLMGVAVALQIFTPHMQMMYYSSLAVTFWFIYRMVLLLRDKTPSLVLARLAVYFTIGFAFSVSLSAIQFLPNATDQRISHRQTGTGLGYEGWNHATQYSMHPLETLGLAVPGFTGEPSSYWAGTNFKGHSEYMGLAVLMFAMVALAYRRNRYTWFFLGLGLFALLFNFGRFTPFFKLPFYLIPMVKNFRAPNMWFFVCGFSLLTLAAYGLDLLLKSRESKSDPETGAKVTKLLGLATGVMALGTLMLAGGKTVWPQVLSGMLPERVGQAGLPYLVQYYPQIVQAAFISTLVAGVVWGAAWMYRAGKIGVLALAGILMILTWGDLMRMDSNWLRVVHPSRVYVRDNIVQTLEKETDPYRVFFFPIGGADNWDNSLLYFRIPTINASMPLRLRWYEELMGTFTFDNFRQYPRLWHMLNTRFIMVRQGEWVKNFEAGLPKVVEDERTGRVLFSNPEAWPRFRLFSKFEVLEDEKAFVPRFNDQNFDWLNTLVLMEQPEFSASPLDGAPPEGEVKLERYSDEEVELTVTTSRPALLYAAETWHPSWTVTVDGASAQLYRANLAMRAVFVQTGTHRVIMRFESKPYLLGKVSSLLSLLVLAGALGWSAYRKDW